MQIEEVQAIIERDTPIHLYEGKRILVLTPDPTRTAPLPMMVRSINEVIGRRARVLDFMVAVGSHRIIEEDQILSLYGLSPHEREDSFRKSRFLCHRWDLPDTLIRIGDIGGREIAEMTNGMFNERVEITINRGIYDYDLLLILSPVFPHEVAGFSGGNKYLFPGISGGDFVHFFHWLAAVLTCMKTIGYMDTPASKLINRAARLVSVPSHCIAMVVGSGCRLEGLFVGPTEEAWRRAAALSARINIVYKDRSFQTVLGRAADMYDEIWTAAKVMYKLEPVVSSGGRLIIYAPHVRELSSTWGEYIERIGYHTSEYYRNQMDRYRDIPKAVLAHCALVKGSGSFANGEEYPRIEVFLATGIPREQCERVNLGYMNPSEIEPEDYRQREEEGVLFVDHAGEILHRLANRT
jgi:nickel-dependent lactate racemase